MLLGPRYEPYEYAMYEYIGLFQNTDRISSIMRKYILLQSESGLSGSVVKNEKPIFNLFPTSTGARIKLEKNLPDIMKDSGYRKVDDRLTALEKETGILTGATVDYGNNIYFDTPAKSKVIWSEVAEGEITLAGNVPLAIK